MLNIANHYVSKTAMLLLLMELSISLVAVYAGANIRFLGELDMSTAFLEFLPSALTFAVALVMGMSALGMYQRDFRPDLRMTLLHLMPSFGMGLCILIFVFYFIPSIYMGRGILMLAFPIAASGILLTRALVYHLSELRFLATKILFLGADELAEECRVAIKSGVSRSHQIAGFISVTPETSRVPKEDILDVDETLLATAKRHDVDEIVVAVQNRRGGNLPIQQLLECKLNGIHVIDAATFFEREACQIRLDSLLPSWLVFGNGFDQSLVRIFVKRAFDISMSTLILIAAAPLMLFTALCIYIEDRTPIFYQQERVGKNGRTFMVLKFRSMGQNAEQAGKPQWAANNDPRTTRVGNIIRKLRIDELPQILNVFKGEMSFVGPRPERPFFVKQLSDDIPFYNVRHSIKPGITGWAQVRYEYGASVEDAIQKLQYDLYYVKNNSLFLDILILIDTVRVVIFGAGR